jgi:hypothetical protein
MLHTRPDISEPGRESRNSRVLEFTARARARADSDSRWWAAD